VARGFSLAGARAFSLVRGSAVAHSGACFPAAQDVFASSTTSVFSGISSPLRRINVAITSLTSKAVSLVWLQFLRAAKDAGFEIPAFCFMPDHVHLVVVGTSDTSDLLEFIRRAKQLSGYYYSRRFRERLRQPDSYEHVLRDNEATGAVIRYVVANPVRAGLVSRLEDYPQFGSTLYSREALIDFLQFPRRWEP
jgi:REP element-mobilizing transposase RayT